ncbi:MAG: VWA domain-containing protein [Candidatus Aureabacteria bacterium]|nr:VWA domain-containing protein [Candidatus Auribacterota bacterium]
MRLENPLYLWFLIPVILIIIFMFDSYRRKKKLLAILGDGNLLKKLSSSLSKFLRKCKIVLISVSLLLSVIAMAGPQWGYKIEQAKTRGVDIMVLLDVSRSMLAEDVKPNRLQLAKTEIRQLIDMLRGDRIGLVVFSGSSVLQCPLTTDYAVFDMFLNDVDTDMVSHGGTDLGKAVSMASKSFEGSESKYRVVLLVTDGEDHGKDTEAAIEDLKAKKIHLYMLGVGTIKGGLIPFRKEDGSTGYLKDKNGNYVNSKLETEIFAKIAKITGSGVYVKAMPGDEDLMEIYKKGIAKLEEREIKASTIRRYEERYQMFLLAALLLLVAESLIEERKKEVEY